MKREWILVASRAGAKIFERLGRNTELRLVEQVHNPEGTLKNMELVTDRPTQTGETGNHARHATSSEQEPREHILERFTLELAALLAKRFDEQKFDVLTIVAEPHTLGMLREAIRPYKRIAVADEVGKNLFHHDVRELPSHLSL